MMAAEWGQMPEDVERRLSLRWYYRWQAWQEAKADAQPQEVPVGGTVSQGNVRRKRVI